LMSVTRSFFDAVREPAVRWPGARAITVLTVALLAAPVFGQDSTDDNPRPIGTGRPAHVAQSVGTCPAPLNVCYYDLSFGQGDPDQVPPILTAGHTPVDAVVPDAATLADCAVLFAENPSNGSFSAEWSANLTDIDAAVQGGMVLVFHDRYVTGATMNIPGMMGANCVRDFADDANVDIVNAGTAVTSGLTNASLDGGNSSSHGYCDALPGGAVNILSRSAAGESVLFSYPHGAGEVAYSTRLLSGGVRPQPSARQLCDDLRSQRG
jgi:hypothetical protein